MQGGGLQELAAGGCCSHGLFSPPFEVVIISLFIHMQAVVLDWKRLGGGRPSPQPPAPPARLPVPPVALPSASSVLHRGAASSSPCVLQAESTGSAAPHSCSAGTCPERAARKGLPLAGWWARWEWAESWVG